MLTIVPDPANCLCSLPSALRAKLKLRVIRKTPLPRRVRMFLPVSFTPWVPSSRTCTKNVTVMTYSTAVFGSAVRLTVATWPGAGDDKSFVTEVNGLGLADDMDIYIETAVSVE
jgi:hypothetical protein